MAVKLLSTRGTTNYSKRVLIPGIQLLVGCGCVQYTVVPYVYMLEAQRFPLELPEALPSLYLL